jgi:hypothetical protein
MATDPMTDTARMKAILVLAASVAFAGAPLVVTSFSGYPPEAFPVPQIDPPVQPAGWAFSIWGVIYLWLLVSAGFGLLRRADRADWDATRWPLIFSLILGTVWLSIAVRDPINATVVIWAMLAATLVALFRTPGQADRALLRAPVALYAGWLTAASSVSLGLLAGGYGLLGPLTAAVAALLVAVGVAAAVQTRLGRYPEYAAGVAWGLLGIVAANLGSAPAVSAAAAAAIAALAVVLWRARPAG